MWIAVVLAAGRGERFGADQNKAFAQLGGRSLLQRSCSTLAGCADRLLVVAAESDLEVVQSCLPRVEVVCGGASRHASEWNALQWLAPTLVEDDVIALHDAARPLLAEADAREVFQSAERDGAALLAERAQLPALRISPVGQVVDTYSAADLWRAQTPQAARAGLLLHAYRQAALAGFEGTDTAAVLQHAGHAVRLVAATGPNPKITVQSDLAVAQSLLGRPIISGGTAVASGDSGE